MNSAFRYTFGATFGALLWLISLSALATTLPDDIEWITNNSDPIFASPDAIRGGRYRTYMMSFPLTLRSVGPDSNGSFAGYLRENKLGLVDFHPDTRKPIPSLATHWAFAPDGKSIYFKLDPDARWSDGKPITADDYLYTIEFMRSKEIVAPWYNNYYSQVILGVEKIDDYTILVRGAFAKPEDEMLAQYGIQPTPKHFHQLDDNWVRDYNWKVEPNTGPYQISAIRKGKYIEFSRVENWWGENKRYYKHRYNVDKVKVKVIRDFNIAYTHFSKGELDTFALVLPQLWHKKSNSKPFTNGLAAKIKFYNDVPQPSYGVYLNEDDPILSDRDVRYGVAHSLNIGKVIKTVLRNDYERLQVMHEGYGEYSNTSIKARQFDLEKANHFFNRAGWVTRDNDGIRTKDNQRLSLRITYGQAAHTPRLVVLKEEARKAGLELELQLLDGSSAFKQITEKKHQLAWMAWGGGGFSPRYWEFFHSDNAHKPQTNNITNTDSPELDSLIMRYREATDKPTRSTLARELALKVHDIGSVVPTFKVPYTRAGYWRWIKLPEFHGTRSTQSLFNPFGSDGGLFWIDPNEKEKIQSMRRLGQSLQPTEIVDTRWRVQ